MSVESLADRFAPRRVISSELIHHGAIWDVLGETVDLGEAGTVHRELLHHPGAVTVLALDDQERVLMIQQYRHPVRSELWELPAGLLDIAGESPVDGAKRELAEEANLKADRWDLLVDWFNSPGGSDEAVRLFLARDVHPVPDGDLHVRTDEELGMPTRWVPLDEQERVLMIQQYRHPVRMELWELPAGLLDVPGESPVDAAKRELAEETDLKAERWDLLTDWFNSPGGSDEAVRLFLARDVHPVPDHELHERTGEELGMPTRWVPLDEARDGVLAGRIHNPGSVIGILAACASRALGWSTLRPADSPWPEHHAYR